MQFCMFLVLIHGFKPPEIKCTTVATADAPALEDNLEAAATQR